MRSLIISDNKIGIHPCIPIPKSITLITFVMKNNHPLIDIETDECVKVTDEDIRDAERIENDPKKILALIDLIFMFEEQKKVIPS